MKKYILLSVLFCISLSTCITPYEATGIEELGDILVVEGIITDNETTIILSRSAKLSDDYVGSIYVDNARVYVACDDGSQCEAEPPLGWDLGLDWRGGKYLLKTGTLSSDHKYWLRIEIEERVYESDPSYPIQTPEIDSIFWMKQGRGQPVMIYVATHSPDNKALFYRWSYKEDWEIHSDLYLEDYPFYCWSMANNKDLLIGSGEKTVFGKITDMLAALPPSSRKLSVMYRINVKQNAISKRAYDYYKNIKKNAEQTGSIFAPIPSELRGNIICSTDPGRLVIGYVDISSTTQKHRFISRMDNVYETPFMACDEVPRDSLLNWYGVIPNNYVLFMEDLFADPPFITYVPVSCVDCTLYGTEQKPENWPDKK